MIKYFKILIIGLVLTILDLAVYEFCKLLGGLILWGWFSLMISVIVIRESKEL